MKKHTKIYFNYFGFGEQDFIPCENHFNKKAVDIHHIDNKGMGGSKNKDNIENLIALCRKCHILAHSGEINKNDLRYMHKCYMAKHRKIIK